MSAYVSTQYVTADSVHELSLQAGSTVSLDLVMLGECCPVGIDSSFNLLVLVLSLVVSVY